MTKPQQIAIIGGGAAGFFTAINCAEAMTNCQITIYEQSNKLLSKVKVSGGGRCNVTHACWTPKELVKFYPRGQKELLGPFHQFCTGDTVAWFADRGVELKIEEDGRMFPVSNQSQTIIDCFMLQAQKLGVKIVKQHKLIKLQAQDEKWHLQFNNGVQITADKVLVAAGSSNTIWAMLQKLGHSIIPPVPSLFTFNIKDDLLTDLAGISLPNVEVKIVTTKLVESGPFLITHWGISGPAVLKLSAFGARLLHEKNYNFTIQLNLLGFENKDEIANELLQKTSKELIINAVQYGLPKRLWKRLVTITKIKPTKNWNDISKKEAHALATNLCAYQMQVKGKSTFKEEFVTAGGIALKEVNMKRFESKLFSNLFFAGEVLNIDAVTGGFNFQAAWTGAYLAAQAIANN